MGVSPNGGMVVKYQGKTVVGVNRGVRDLLKSVKDEYHGVDPSVVATVKQMWKDGKTGNEIKVVTGLPYQKTRHWFKQWSEEEAQEPKPVRSTRVLFINTGALEKGGLDSCCYLPTEDEAIKLGCLIANTRYVKCDDIPECMSAGDYIDRFWRV